VILVVLVAAAFGQNAPAPQAPAPPVPPAKQARDLLDKALQDKNPDTRKNAVIALSLTGPVEPFPAELQSMLDDKDVEVRLAAVSSLVDLRNDRTIPALKKALTDAVPEVSFAAARAL
jgi:HEAT repeat protein